MFQVSIQEFNFASALIVATIVNALLPCALAVGVTSWLAWRKRWNAASRYGAWWLMLVLVLISPWAPRQSRPVRLPMEAPAAAMQMPSVYQVPAQIMLDRQAVSAPVRDRISPSGASIFVLGWILAAMFQLIRLAGGLGHSLRLKLSVRAPDAATAEVFQRLLRQVGVRRCVGLGISDAVKSPAVVGYFRPHVLLPAGLSSCLESFEVEQILLHELAHVERLDDWAIVIQRMLEAVAIVHPLVHYLTYRMHLDREMACDDRVTSFCEPRRYAACLTRVAEMWQVTGAGSALARLFERKSELRTRVEMLLDRTREHKSRISLRRLGVVCFSGAMLAAVGVRMPRLLAEPVRVEAVPPLPVHVSTPVSAPVTQPVPQEPTASSQTLPKRVHRDADPIVITDAAGQSSTFGAWSDDANGTAGHERRTIVFRTHGKPYIIRDPSVVNRALEILRPMQELGRRQGELGKQQAKLGEQQAHLGEEQAKVAEEQMSAATEEAVNRQMRDMEEKLRQLDTEKVTRSVRQAQERLAELQSRLGAMQALMGSESGKMGEKQGHLGERQGRLGEQASRLGELQSQLGQEQSRHAKRMEELLKQLIREAQEHHLAQPLPE